MTAARNGQSSNPAAFREDLIDACMMEKAREAMRKRQVDGRSTS
jgi:hypothetical protein